MLSGPYAELLPEWLSSLAASGQRIPAEHLPALLEFARSNAQARTSNFQPLLKRSPGIQLKLLQALAERLPGAG